MFKRSFGGRKFQGGKKGPPSRSRQGGTLRRDEGGSSGGFGRQDTGARSGGFSRGGGRSSGGGGGGRRPATRPLDYSQFVKKAIQVTEVEAFHPEHKFADFHIHSKLKDIIAKRDFVHPTPIQDGAIPHVLAGRDVVGLANTGTGKTGAFLIPLINKVFHDAKQKVLILAPTRELAQQIDEEFRAFSAGSGLRSAMCIGGSHMHTQITAVRRHPHFVIGTPGRLKDLLERQVLDLSDFNNVVLDEVDRMLDMGFIRDIKHLLSLMRAERQSLFFSATMPREIRDLTHAFLKNPVTVAIKARATAENVDQDVIYVKDKAEKLEALHELLLQPEFKKVLVFGRTKYGSEKLAKALALRGFKADSIHGGKSQSQRERSLRAFKAEQLQVLVATDVAARGLDIPDVTHVINFDIPETYEDYIHRIGRTGRWSKTGVALTFIERGHHA